MNKTCFEFHHNQLRLAGTWLMQAAALALMVALAMPAVAADAEIGLLGVDVLRDVESEKLFVSEVNSLGYTWHFSSPSGRAYQQQFGLSLESQFDGRRKAARILAEQTRRLAC